jgi:hypothetical protein
LNKASATKNSATSRRASRPWNRLVYCSGRAACCTPLGLFCAWV